MELNKSSYPFNTPLESGIRSLMLLAAMTAQDCDVQRLVYYDYIMVHTEDVLDAQDTPHSIHPATPYRSGEALVRRELVDAGVRLMVCKGLAEVEYTSTGISFRASENTNAFLSYLECNYAVELSERAQWVVNHFRSYDDVSLREFMFTNLGRWGAEFDREALLMEFTEE